MQVLLVVLGPTIPWQTLGPLWLRSTMCLSLLGSAGPVLQTARSLASTTLLLSSHPMQRCLSLCLLHFFLLRVLLPPCPLLPAPAPVVIAFIVCPWSLLMLLLCILLSHPSAAFSSPFTLVFLSYSPLPLLVNTDSTAASSSTPDCMALCMVDSTPTCCLVLCKPPLLLATATKD